MSKSTVIVCDDDVGLMKIPELTQARVKFDGILQNIMVKQEDLPREIDDDDDMKQLVSSQEYIEFSRSAGCDPHKKRRKKRHDTSVDSGGSAYIAKIYDCSVNLANFNEDSPLYPMASAWIRNKPNERIPMSAQRSDDVEINPTAEDDDEMGIITQLPPPVPCRAWSVRIPSPLPPSGVEFDLGSDETSVPTPLSELMDFHKKRWKTIRYKWKEAGFINEARYKESVDILNKCRAPDVLPAQFDDLEELI